MMSTDCEHEFISREYSSQPYGTCLSCGQTVFQNKEKKMEGLNDILAKAEEKKRVAYEKYSNREKLGNGDLSSKVGVMEYYMDISNAFFDLLKELKDLNSNTTK